MAEGGNMQYEPVTRPHFTVTQAGKSLEPDRLYDANHIFYFWAGEEYHLGFICSGSLKIMPIRYVGKIEFHPDGAGYCGECDEPLKKLRQMKTPSPQ